MKETMSNLARIQPAPADDDSLLPVLRSSLYPGASDDSIRLVLGYCKAAQLDPMHKPVHIVPMWDAKSRTMRDVVMPGIDLYRVKASRTGYYAGCSEPEFGPDETRTLGGAEITFPSWCRVTVRRLVAGSRADAPVVAEFTAVERWVENYATKGRDSAQPNAMWTKRPYGQLAKCAEAQALRKAFPEVGSGPTAEEMAGKTIDADTMPPPTAPVGASDSLLESARNAANEGTETFRTFWRAIPAPDRQALTPALGSLKEAAEAADADRTVDATAATPEAAE